MGYKPEPTRKRRFDVPISSGQSGKRDRVRKQHHPAGKETNRALIDAGIVVGATLIVTLVLLAISGQISDTTAGNLIARSAPPAPQLSLSASPAASAQATRSPTPGAESPTPARTPDDSELQAAIEKKLEDTEGISPLGITATVSNGKVVLAGTAPTDELKSQVEKLVRAIKGVKEIDNQIFVGGNP